MFAEIERLREEDEYTASMDAVKKASHDEGDENLSQWTAFGVCAATCGRSIQTRTRMCKTGKICKEPTIQSRTCIQTPCPSKISKLVHDRCVYLCNLSTYVRRKLLSAKERLITIFKDFTNRLSVCHCKPIEQKLEFWLIARIW